MRPCENPFRVECLQRLPFRFQETSLQELLLRLEALQFQGAIVGPHGHGKSTLLALLEQTLNAQGHRTAFLQLTEETRCTRSSLFRSWLASVDASTILLLDGAERLSWWNWQVLKSVPKRGVILTTHRPGFLQALYECRSSPELLDELVEDLTQGDSGMVTRDLRQLYADRQGNIRECLRTLYDDAALLPAREHGQNTSLLRVAPAPR